jgi:hypothetical protein
MKFCVANVATEICPVKAEVAVRPANASYSMRHRNCRSLPLSSHCGTKKLKHIRNALIFLSFPVKRLDTPASSITDFTFERALRDDIRRNQ